MQGVACILVILHHLSGHISSFWLFQYVGYLAVGFFLFCSGYGLVISLNGKIGYLRHLILVRIPSMLLAYLIANVIYLCVRLATGTFKRGGLLDFLFGGNAIVSYSWYIICILYLYMAFWLCHVCFREHPHIADASLVIAVALWVAVMIYSGANHPHRYNAVICFLGGYFAGRNKRFGEAMVGRTVLFMAAAVLPPSFVAVVFCGVQDFPIWIRLIFMELSVCAFVIIMLNSGSIFCSMAEKSVFDSLGKFSLEFYLYQGLVMLLFRNSLVHIGSDLLFCMVVFSGSVIIGKLMHCVDARLNIFLEQAVENLT